ncbi:MAG: hypothetical protein ABI358_11265 [Ginsengibacter sp.]
MTIKKNWVLVRMVPKITGAIFFPAVSRPGLSLVVHGSLLSLIY